MLPPQSRSGKKRMGSIKKRTADKKASKESQLQESEIGKRGEDLLSATNEVN